jgi:4-coumarate--CoA ligase (photoactive yellow protein activation family)
VRLLSGHVAAFLKDRGRTSAEVSALLTDFVEPDPLRQPDASREGADDLTADPAGLDSLALLELLSRLTQTFELQRTGVEDHMLIAPRLNAWADLLQKHWDLLGDEAAIIFRTSGSTGNPGAVRHPVNALRREAALHVASTLPARPARIVAMVPVQHIYGAIFTAFLPDHLGVPLLDLSQAPPSRLARCGHEGDLVIGTPFTWDLLLASVPRLPAGMHGVVSAAPAQPELWSRAAAAGLASLTEIYGATETGGVATRSSGAAPFRLLPGLSFAPGSEDERGANVNTEAGHALDIQDRIHRCGPRLFHVLGRRDGAVQVGGVNVSPEQTRRCIARVDGVADAAVRFQDGRLHAFVVPENGTGDVRALISRIRTVLAETLPPPARPQTVSSGPSLPRDSMGKLCAWSVQDGVPADRPSLDPLVSGCEGEPASPAFGSGQHRTSRMGSYSDGTATGGSAP